jgi:hypothetical protein
VAVAVAYSGCLLLQCQVAVAYSRFLLLLQCQVEVEDNFIFGFTDKFKDSILPLGIWL